MIRPQQIFLAAGALILFGGISFFGYKSLRQVSTTDSGYEHLATISQTTGALSSRTVTASSTPKKKAEPSAKGGSSSGGEERVIRTVVFVQPTSSPVVAASPTTTSTTPKRTLKPRKEKVVSPPPPPAPKPTVKEKEDEEVEEAPAGPVELRITEVMVGTEASADDEFIELFNEGSEAVSLTGFSIKKRSSTGTESALVSAARFEGKVIPAGRYFLIAHDGLYQGSVEPDATWPASYSLAYTNNAVVLYDPAGVQLAEVSWTELMKGESTEGSVPSPQNTSE